MGIPCFGLQSFFFSIFLKSRPLRHTTSWDMPPPISSTASNRSLDIHEVAPMPSVTSAATSLALSRTSQIVDENSMHFNTAGLSSSSSEHDNQDNTAWSSDCSCSEDEFNNLEDNMLPVSRG